MLQADLYSNWFFINTVMAWMMCCFVALKADDLTAGFSSFLGLVLSVLVCSENYAHVQMPMFVIFFILWDAFLVVRLLVSLWEVYVHYFTERGRQSRQRVQKIAQTREAIAARGGYTDPARNKNPHDERLSP